MSHFDPIPCFIRTFHFLMLGYFDQITILSFIFVFYLCVFKSLAFKFEISTQKINSSVIFTVIFVYIYKKKTLNYIFE